MNIAADTKRLMPELLQILGLPTEFEDYIFCFSVIRSHTFSASALAGETREVEILLCYRAI